MGCVTVTHEWGLEIGTCGIWIPLLGFPDPVENLRLVDEETIGTKTVKYLRHQNQYGSVRCVSTNAGLETSEAAS
jgi:hypothetical protein